jgi:hypothetical protein
MSVAIDWSMVAPEFRTETRKTVTAIAKLRNCWRFPRCNHPQSDGSI